MPRKSPWAKAEQSGISLSREDLQVYEERIRADKARRGKVIRSTQNAEDRLHRLKIRAGLVDGVEQRRGTTCGTRLIITAVGGFIGGVVGSAAAMASGTPPEVAIGGGAIVGAVGITIFVSMFGTPAEDMEFRRQIAEYQRRQKLE